MNLFKSFLIIILLSTLLGCGKSSKKILVDNTQTFEDSQELKAAIADQYVSCGVEGLDCPDFSAKLVYWGQESEASYYLGVCSGTLYNSKYIITNSHCIPEELKTAGANCSKSMKILFPKNRNSYSEEVKCSRVVQVFDQESHYPDLAIIELERAVNRVSVQVVNNGFIENSIVKAYVMDPSPVDKSQGVIRLKTCTLSTDNAYILSTKSTSANAMIFGSNCNVISGNSGSGLLNSSSELIGVIYAKIERNKLEEFYVKAKIKYSGFTYMGVAQNISCFKDIISNAGVGCSMAVPTKEDLNDYVERVLSQQGMSSRDRSQVEYLVGPGFKLELSRVQNPEVTSTLESFESAWLKNFISVANANEVEYYYQSFMSR